MESATWKRRSSVTLEKVKQDSDGSSQIQTAEVNWKASSKGTFSLGQFCRAEPQAAPATDLTLERNGQTAWLNFIVYCSAFLKAKGVFTHIQSHIHLHFSS